MNSRALDVMRSMELEFERDTKECCHQCEDGLIEHIVAGSASKNDSSFCDCAEGVARGNEYWNNLESLGADKYDRQQHGEPR